MVEFPGRRLRSKSGNWHRFRFQLAGALLFAALLPYLVRIATLTGPNPPGQIGQTLVGSVCAIVAGTWLFRNLSTYPGVEASAYIVPSFSLSYATTLFVFFLGRFDYNRGILLAGFLISIVWFYIVYSRMNRQQALRIGLVPFGAVDMIKEVGSIEWLTLTEPTANVTHIDGVVADLRIDMPDDWDRCLADFALLGIPVYHVKHLHESLTGRVEVEHLSENSFGSLAPSSAYLIAKHVSEWIAAAVVLAVTSPLLAIVALAIRIDSPGPAIFRQRRVGYRGRRFEVYKFRTMMLANEGGEAREAAITRAADLRVTRLGRFLRATRIDEIPQLFNVLKGEMSWIGPRPEAEILSKWYEAEIPFYRYRHIVRPGITGWAQVSQGHVAEVDEVRAKLHYDFYYIKNFSPWIDMLIVGRTIRTMLTGFGSR